MSDPSDNAEAGSHKETLDQARRLLDQGRRLLGEGRYSEAAEAFNRATVCDLDDTEARRLYVQALIRLEAYDDALQVVNQALEIDPRNVGMHILHADLLDQLGRHEEAISVLQRARELEPDNPEAHIALIKRRVEEQQAADQPVPSPPAESAADRADFDRYANQLRWARERGLRALEATSNRAIGASWAEILLPAAQQLLDALTSLAESDRFWQILQDRTVQLQTRDLRGVQEILDQDLAALLVFMGYRPPPPPQLLELELKDALADVLEARDDISFGEARRVQQNLALFTFRLRRVITAAGETPPPDELLDKQQRGDSQGQRPWRRLRAAVDKATMVAVPAMLAAGIVTIVFPPAGPAAAAAGFSAAAAAAGRELLKDGTQLAATALLHKMTADEPALATAEEQLANAWKRARNAVLDLRSALIADRREPQWEKVIDVYAVECVSALYGLLQAEERSHSGARHALPATVGRTRDLVNRVRDVARMASSRDSDLAEERADLAGRLLAVEQELWAILSAAL